MMCKGKTAIVTGAAGKGMGRSIALTFAREGANVVVNYRTSAESAAAIVAHIEGRGGRAIAVRADVTESAAFLCSAAGEFVSGGGDALHAPGGIVSCGGFEGTGW
jgi:NAD(P)-dependent dehydrogenase (short-subunit alcohol dehydrogenase family)